MIRFHSLSALSAGFLMTVWAGAAGAAPVLRVQVDQHGDFVLLGNTLAQECANNTPAPVVGDVGNCGNNLNDTAPDVFWRADSPTAGAANANNTITAAQARSTAVLQIPSGATITHAYLYWAATRQAAGADNTCTLERPGTFSTPITAAQTWTGTQNSYQGYADVTALVQQHGVGPYRVSDVEVVNLVNLNSEDSFAGWWMVVFYQLLSDPPRNLALFDGFDVVQAGQPQAANLSGFLVPQAGFDAKLGVVAFEGDDTLNGDRLFFNPSNPTNPPQNEALSDALNPIGNFFNATRSNLGLAVSVPGDLPQLLGTARSMSGVDIDVVDISSKLVAGQTQAPIRATSSQDRYWLAGFVTSISTFKPDFSTTGKTVVDVNGGGVMPGDVLEYTITATNSGNDTSINTILTDDLPAGVTFVPGSIQITAGANAGAKTDAADTDQGEYLAVPRRVRVRLGVGADGTTGGTLAPGASTTVVFRVTVDATATGTISNQAIVTAGGQQGAPSENYPSDGNGANPGSPPTPVVVDHCSSNSDCSGATPYCDVTQSPKTCVACLDNTHCTGATPYCQPGTKTCGPCTQDSQCTDPTKPACQTAGTLAGSCGECSATNATLCVGPKPLCLTAVALCGCDNSDGDSECGALDSGMICNGTQGICVAGCVIAPNRNGCPANQYCSDQTGGVGNCVGEPCMTDTDCTVAPLTHCDTTPTPHLCVQCLLDTQCVSPQVCNDTGNKTCVECTPSKTANCLATGNGAICLTDGTCGCATDTDCGGADSGRVCDSTTWKCLVGCRGTGGNGCPTGLVCTSTDNTIGQCVVADSGVGGSAGAAGSGGTAGAAGEGGTAGTGGIAGSAGAAGEGGTAGLAGSGGSAGGAAGKGGAAGAAGKAGAAGNAGAGGKAGASGDGGLGGKGGGLIDGGIAGKGGGLMGDGSIILAEPGALEGGGCGCSTPGQRTGLGPWAAIAGLASLLFRSRRRRRNP